MQNHGKWRICAYGPVLDSPPVTIALASIGKHFALRRLFEQAATSQRGVKTHQVERRRIQASRGIRYGWIDIGRQTARAIVGLDGSLCEFRDNCAAIEYTAVLHARRCKNILFHILGIAFSGRRLNYHSEQVIAVIVVAPGSGFACQCTRNPCACEFFGRVMTACVRAPEWIGVARWHIGQTGRMCQQLSHRYFPRVSTCIRSWEVGANGFIELDTANLHESHDQSRSKRLAE